MTWEPTTTPHAARQPGCTGRSSPVTRHGSRSPRPSGWELDPRDAGGLPRAKSPDVVPRLITDVPGQRSTSSRTNPDDADRDRVGKSVKLPPRHLQGGVTVGTPRVRQSSPPGKASAPSSGTCSRSPWTRGISRSCRTKARSTSPEHEARRDYRQRDGGSARGAHAVPLSAEMVVGLLLIAVLWQILSFFVPPFIVPGWERIFNSLVTLPHGFVLITLARVAAALVDLLRARPRRSPVAMYLWTPVERYLRPVVRLFMAVPVVCWILFAVLWFKWVEFRIAFVLVVVCAPVFLVDFLDAMKGVSQGAARHAALLPAEPHAVLHQAACCPPRVPAILTSWKINLSLAIRVVTIAELVGAVTGIGYGLVVAQELFSVADVFAWTLDPRHHPASSPKPSSRSSRNACCGGAYENGRRRHRGARACARSSTRRAPGGRWWPSTASISPSAAATWSPSWARPAAASRRSSTCSSASTGRSAGRIAIGGRTPYDDFDHFRGVLAAVFQQDRLLPWRTRDRQVRLPLELLGRERARQVERAALVARSPRSRSSSRAPIRTSCRAACGSAWRSRVPSSSNRSLLLADEAFGHLDEVTPPRCARPSSTSRAREGNTAIVVTHQLEEAIEHGRPHPRLRPARHGFSPTSTSRT